MKVEIITPDKQVFEGEADVVTLPGINGSFQILKDHAPIVSTLAKGKLWADKQSFVIEGGVVEVLKNKVLVLAEAVIEE
jgi:F-type H+-transporting ATPase subunit epsilon